MTPKQHMDLARRIEDAKGKRNSQLSPRSQEAILWFLDFIDNAEPAEVNAYIEQLDEQQLVLLKRTTPASTDDESGGSVASSPEP